MSESRNAHLTPYVNSNGDVQNLPPGIIRDEALSPLVPSLKQISQYIDSAVKEQQTTEINQWEQVYLQ